VIPRWWEEFPGRLEAEIEAFRRRDLEFAVDERERAGGRIVLAGSFRLASGRAIPLRVVFPDSYPRTRFHVFATERNDRIAAHQNPIGGNLCLLARGSRHWDPAWLAADVIADRIELIYAPGGVPLEQEDAQGEPITSYLPYMPNGGIIVAENCFELPRGATGGRLRVVFDDTAWLFASPSDRDPPIGRGLLLEVKDSEGATLAKADEALRGAVNGSIVAGLWERVEQPPDPRNIEHLFERGAALIRSASPKAWTMIDGDRFFFAALLIDEEVQRGKMRPNFVFQFVRQKARTGQAEGPFPVRTLRYGAATRGARVPELAPLASRTAAVIGLGSLGAPLAVTLARSGIAALRLADFDFVEPAGGVRWISDLAAAGALKTAALRASIARDFPLTRVETFELLVGRAPVERDLGVVCESALLASWAKDAPILIDATAEDDVSRVVSAVGERLRIPQVYVWSYNAFGGVVVRVIPGKTGCWYCAQLHLSPEGGTITDLPVAAVDPDGRRRVQPIGCADATFTGEAASLTPLADHAARVAFGILCSGEAGAYPSYRDDLFVLRLREPNGALVTPQWRSFPLRVHPHCPTCNP